MPFFILGSPGRHSPRGEPSILPRHGRHGRLIFAGIFLSLAALYPLPGAFAAKPRPAVHKPVYPHPAVQAPVVLPNYANISFTGVVRKSYPNGLVLLSKESHAAPVVSVWVYYRVGSRDEVQGIFGISHQIEHMMFKGTEKLAPGDIDRLFSERGGVNNAMTTQDYTAYNETLPSSALDVALQVESDRMQNSAMAPRELAHEKTVVMSEIEGDENGPLYKLDTAVSAAAFEAHPYHHPIGGYLSDIRRFADTQVRNYYNRFYAPNNAIVVVVGDFNTVALQRAVGYYFKATKARPIFDQPITTEPTQHGERRIQVEGVGHTAYVQIAYHVPQTGARAHYVMDVISTILASSGRSSRLYRSLVEKGLATEVDAGDADMKDPYLMGITATVADGHTQQEVEDAIEAEIARLKSEPVSADELQKTVNQVKASFVYRDDSVTSQASELGMYAILGNYRYSDTYLRKIQSVTPEEIQAVAKEYLSRENRTVGWFVPRAPRPGEAIPTTARGGGMHYHSLPASGLLGARASLENRDLAAVSAKLDPAYLINRRWRHTSAAHPAPHPAAPALPPVGGRPILSLVPGGARSHAQPFREVLPNGMVVIIYPNHANPDVSVSGSLRGGSFVDPAGKAGMANYVATMVNRGTASRTEDQIASALDFVGATAEVSAGSSQTFINGHALREDLPLVLDILSDELRNPSFPMPVIDRVRNEIQTAIQEGDNDPATVSMQSLFASLYPDDYPLHWPVIGTADSVKSITRDDLQSFHDEYYRPDLATIVIVGDVNPRAAANQVERAFRDWSNVGPKPKTEPQPLEHQIPPQRVIKTMPDKTEAVVAMGFRGITRHDPGYYPAYLMNLILGNSDFNSRLMKDVRDRKGLVYYVASDWDAGIAAGPWLLEMESNPANVDRAIGTVLSDMRQMQRQGATPEEMKLFKSWVKGNQALRLETSSGIADMLEQSEIYGLGLDYLWRYPSIIYAVTPAQVLMAARRYLHPDAMVTSIAGPYPPGG